MEGDASPDRQPPGATGSTLLSTIKGTKQGYAEVGDK